MENNLSNKRSLAQYIAEQQNKKFYDGVIERYLLATELLNSYNDECEASKSDVKHRVSFFNPDNIEITDVGCDDGVPRYNVVLPVEILQEKTPFANVQYAHCELLYTKNLFGKLIPATQENVWKRSDDSEQYAIHTLATLMFEICFCSHPFKGRKYYADVDIGLDRDREFFAQKHKFIFDIEDNDNRFVNGPHSYAWALWDQTSEIQRQFWKNAFYNEKWKYSDFRSGWLKAYDSYMSISSVYTPCGEKLTALVYDEDYILIPSNCGIGCNAIRCKYCKEGIRQKCASACPVPAEKQVARFNKQSVTLIYRKTSANSDGSEQISERRVKAKVYDGKIVKTADFNSETESKELFKVVCSSKHRDLLGLQCLTDDPTVVSNAKGRTSVSRNGVIALLPDTQIQVGTNYYIETVAAPPKQVAVPTPKAVEPKQVAAPASTPKQAVDANQQQTTNARKSILLEDGTLLELIGDPDGNALIGKGSCSAVYKVKDTKSNNVFALKLYNSPMPAAFVENLRFNVIQGAPGGSFLWPRGIAQADNKGNNVGYVMDFFDMSRYDSLAKIIKGKACFPSVELQLDALIHLTEVFKQLSEKGYVFCDLNAGSVLFDCARGQVLVCDCDRIALHGKNLEIQCGIKWTAPEVAIEMFNADVYSDLFSLAAIIFGVLVHAHPFDGIKRGTEPMTNSVREKVYGTEPVFIFHPQDASNRPNSQTDADVIKAWQALPDYIQKLFVKTFTSGMPDNGKSSALIASARKERATKEEWLAALKKWKNSIAGSVGASAQDAQ